MSAPQSAENDAGRYEPCVMNSDGDCSRWSHDHDAENGVPIPPPHVHDWRADSSAFTSWRICLTCGKQEWFMEVDLP